jgi:flagellar biosynthesis/type III secretory pathway chaperone
VNFSEKQQELLAALEDYLVREFRLLQSLHNVTKSERLALSKEKAAHLLPIVEEKEALLDELSQLEEGRKTVTASLSMSFGAASSTVTALFPYLEDTVTARLSRLSDGITTLVNQTRELNHGNQALATFKVEWLDAAQTYLINLVQPPTSYYPPGVNHQLNQWTPSIDIEHRA